LRPPPRKRRRPGCLLAFVPGSRSPPFANPAHLRVERESLRRLPEQLLRYLDAALPELVGEDRMDAGGLERSDNRSVAAHVLDVELEDVLQRDHIRLHPLYLRDRGDS